MARLEFGVWDALGAYELARSPVPADIYEQHIREVQLASAPSTSYGGAYAPSDFPWGRRGCASEAPPCA